MSMRHLKYNSLILAETIYRYVGDQPFVISDLRDQGVIPMDLSVGSALNDLRNNYYLESAEGFRRAHYSNITKRRMYWRFTRKFLDNAQYITRVAEGVRI